MDMTVVGMISGTSYDAIDAAVADCRWTATRSLLRPRACTRPRSRTRCGRGSPPACRPPTPRWRRSAGSTPSSGQLFGRVAPERDRALTGGADLVVSHGQTVFHWVEGDAPLGTLQLAAAAWIAEATGTTVVSDLRSRDITRGGHGAPLASTLDALMLLDERRCGAARSISAGSRTSPFATTRRVIGV